MTAHNADAPLLIEMVSDVVCPWCWLGLRRLEAAIALSGMAVDVRYRPFQLDPAVPEAGLPYRDYMAARFGSGEDADGGRKSRFSAMREALEAYGEAEGIPFRFSGIEVRPNTINAHRLIRWAQGQGLGLPVKEALFRAYFTDHRDIGDIATLVAIGHSAGLHRDVLEKLYASDADKDQTQREEARFRAVGISGVPTFIAGGRYAIQGAEDAETLAAFIRDAASRLSTAG